MRTTLKALGHRLLVIMASSYVLMFFSELYFFNETAALNALAAIERSGWLGLSDVLELTLWYAPCAYLLLAGSVYFRVRSLAALVLVATLFSWAVEGLLVSLVYTAMPITIAWPSLGWHVLFDVLLGWWGLQVVLAKNRPILTAAVAVLLGLIWGIWTTWWWIDGSDRLTMQQFALFAMTYGTLCIAALFVLRRSGLAAFKPTRAGGALLILYSLFLYGVMVVSVGVLAFVMLPLVGLVLLALWRNRQGEIRPNLLTTLSNHTPWYHYPILLLMPLSAIIAYTMLLTSNYVLPLADIIAPLLMLIGTIVFSGALLRTFRRPAANLQTV